MITTNVIERVFHIRAANATATAFTLEVDQKQYLVTAAHVVDKLSAPYTLEIFHQQEWKTIDLELTGISSNADVAIFAAKFQLSSAFEFPPDTEGVLYGQDVFFLGFPYGLSQPGGAFRADFPFPFVKKACLSAFVTEPNGTKTLYLDGHNNPGFSGGPIIFSKRTRSDVLYQALGVVSGYRYAEEAVFHQGQELPITIKANTGIVIGYSIQHVVEEVRKNPNGFNVSA